MGRVEHDRGDAGGVDAVVPALRQVVECSPVRRDSRLDPVMEHQLRDGGGRHQRAVHLPRHRAHRPLRRCLLDGGQNPGARILRRALGRGDGDGRSVRGLEHVPLFHVLGADRGSPVPPHRYLGRVTTRLRSRQVSDLHPVWKRADAGRDGHPAQRDRHSRLQGPRRGPRQPIDDNADLAVRGFPRRFRGEGTHVSGTHVAPRRPHRSADRGQRDPGRDPPEDGRLRVSANLTSHPSRGRAGLPATTARNLRHRHRLRRLRDPGPEGRQAPHRVLERQPHGLRHAGDLHPRSERSRRRDSADDQPRHHYLGSFSVRRHDLRAHPHPTDRGLRRCGQDRSDLLDAVGALLSGRRRIPWAELVRR